MESTIQNLKRDVLRIILQKSKESRLLKRLLKMTKYRIMLNK